MPQEIDPRTLNPAIRADDRVELAVFLRALANMFDRARAYPVFAPATAEVGDSRTVTVTVSDRLQRAFTGQRWLCLVWISATDLGAPGGTQTVAVSAGTVIQTIAANQAYVILTDTNAQISLGVQVLGAGTRHVHCVVLNAAEGSGSISWA